MLCGYSSNALQTFSPNPFFFFCLFLTFRGTVFLIIHCSHREGQSSRVELRVYTSLCVFSLEGRDRTGPSHSWKYGGGGGGGGGFWCRLRAGNDGSCSFNERPSNNKKKKKGKTDTGHVKNHQPRPPLCKSILRNDKL